MQENTREHFATSWGAILTTAGVAIGLGNIWRFPYMVGSFGGGGFLIVYLVVVLAFGVPALMCEWALGRSTRRGPMGAFQSAGMPGARLWSGLLLVTIVMASSYYTVVLAWVLYYALLFAGSAADTPSQQIFTTLTSTPWLQFSGVLVCILLACTALATGVRSGIERCSRAIMPLFFILFLLLVGRTLSLEGAWSRLLGYLAESSGQFSPRTVLAAMGQGMFSLSLGGTFMVIYGSYLRRRENIPNGALWTALLDVSAAILAFLVVVPAVLVLEIDMESGPPLLFVVMPQVFQGMEWGNLLGTIFFASVLLVGMLSLIGAYEVVVGACKDAWGISRHRTLAVLAAIQLVLAVPPMFIDGYIFYSDLVWGTTMQPFGAALAMVALLWCQGRAKALGEISRNSRLVLPRFLFYWMKYVVPTGVLIALVYGWLG